ncbi:MAG: FAD-dependent oxidoreductase, partial [Acidobacteria bacterium]
MNSKPHVVILGAGPAGLGAAYRLAQRGTFQTTVLEKNKAVGG